jgi:hypothetical protein
MNIFILLGIIFMCIGHLPLGLLFIVLGFLLYNGRLS